MRAQCKGEGDGGEGSPRRCPGVPTQGHVPAGKRELASRYIFRYSCPNLRPGPKVAVFAALSTVKLVRLVMSMTIVPVGAA